MTDQQKIDEIQTALKEARNELTGMGNSGIFGTLRADTVAFITDCERVIRALGGVPA